MYAGMLAFPLCAVSAMPRHPPTLFTAAVFIAWISSGCAAALGQDASCVESYVTATSLGSLSEADVEHVRLELAIDPERPPATGRAIVTLRTIDADADSVHLLAPGMEVSKVISSDLGEELPFRWDGIDTLFIDLSAVRDTFLVARESVTLDIGLEVLHGIRFEGGYVWTMDPVLLGGSWFPWSGDSEDRFTSELHLTTSPDAVVTATGSALARGETADGRVTHLFSSIESHRSDDLLFAAGPFVRARSGFKVETLYPPFVRAHPGGLARRALEYFESELEYPYPFGVLTLVVVPGIESSISRGGMILVPARLTDVPASHLPQYSQLELVEAVARQWFGSVLSAASPREVWLESGLSAYLAAAYAESEIGSGAFEVAMRRLAGMYFDEGQSYESSSTASNVLRRVHGRARASQAKGAWAAHSLRRLVGDNGFWEALAEILSENAFETVKTNDLADAVESVADEPVSDFLHDWMLSPGHPELAASYSTARDTLFVTIEQRQLGDGVPEVYDLPLSLEVGTLSGSLSFDVRLDELRETYAFPISADARFVVVDPDMRYLMEVNMEQSLSGWIAQLRGASTSRGRLSATRGIAQRRGHADVLIGLRSALTQESNPYVKAAILDVVRQLSDSEAAQRAIISAFEDTSAVVRAAALRALSAFHGSPEIEQLALHAANEDPSQVVQATAVETLPHIGSDQAPDVARAALITPSHDDVIRRAGLRALGSLDAGTPVALEAASTYSAADQPVPVRLESIGLLEKIAARARLAENILLERLTSGNPLVRLAAAGSLLRLGNEAAVERFVEGEPIKHVRRQVVAFLACR